MNYTVCFIYIHLKNCLAQHLLLGICNVKHSCDLVKEGIWEKILANKFLPTNLSISYINFDIGY